MCADEEFALFFVDGEGLTFGELVVGNRFDETAILVPDEDLMMFAVESIDVLKSRMGIEIGQGKPAPWYFEGATGTTTEEAFDSVSIRGNEESFIDGKPGCLLDGDRLSQPRGTCSEAAIGSWEAIDLVAATFQDVEIREVGIDAGNGSEIISREGVFDKGLADGTPSVQFSCFGVDEDQAQIIHGGRELGTVACRERKDLMIGDGHDVFLRYDVGLVIEDD